MCAYSITCYPSLKNRESRVIIMSKISRKEEINTLVKMFRNNEIGFRSLQDALLNIRDITLSEANSALRKALM